MSSSALLVSDPAAVWKAAQPQATYHDARDHAVFVKQVAVIGSLDQRISALEGGKTPLMQVSSVATVVGGSGSTFTGVLPISQGGTALTALGLADQVLGVKHDGSALEYKSLLVISGQLAVTDAAGSITFGLATSGTAGSYGSGTQVPALTTDAYGRVTAASNTAISAISFSAPGEFSVSGSPVSPGGSLSVSWVNQSANHVLAGPPSGGAAAPTFRALAAADIPSLSYVSSVGLSAPSWLSVSGSPVTSSGTLAVSAAMGQTANEFLATPNGSSGAVGLRAIAAADLGSGASSSKFLRGDMTWSAAVIAPAGSNTQVQFNSSGAFGADAGFTYGGAGGSTLVGLAPTSTSAAIISVTLPASSAQSVLEADDSSGYPNIRLRTTATQTFAEFFSPTGSTSGSGIRMGLNAYAVLGGFIGGLNIGVNIAGSWNQTAGLNATPSENQSSGHFGSDLNLFATPPGAASVVDCLRITGKGSVVANPAGSALPTTSTDGFVYVSSGAGAPSGSPSAYTGSRPLYYDQTNGVLDANNGSHWFGVGVVRGVVQTVTGNYACLTTDGTVILAQTSTGKTVTLPANCIPGFEVLVLLGASSVKVTIAAGGSDSISDYGTVGSFTLAPSGVGGGTYTNYARLIYDGSATWYVVGAK